MFVGEVEVGAFADDARLGLDGDLGPLAGAQLQCLGEAPFASVHVVAVHRGVVEEVDAGIPGGADEGADVVIWQIRDPHQAENYVGRSDVAQGDGLHDGLRWWWADGPCWT